MAEQISRLTLAVDSSRAKANADKLTNSLDKTTLAGERTAKAAKATAAAFKFIAAAAAISAVSVVNDLRKIQSVNVRLAGLTGDLAGQQKFLSDTAKELSQDYVTLADGYARLLPLYDGGLLTLQETQAVTIGLADASVALGAGQAAVGQAIYGFSQGLAAGTLKAEEFNQVTEPMPGLINRIDEAAGLTAGGFRKLVNEGKVTSDYFKDVLIKALQSYEGAAAAASNTISATFTRTKNAYTQAIAAFETPISAATIVPAEALAAVLEKVAENADLITKAALTAGTVIAASFAANTIKAVTSYAVATGAAAVQAAKLEIAQAAGLGTAAGAAAAKLNVARATAAETAAEVASLEVKLAKLPIDQQSGVVATQLASARTLAAAATAELTIAERAAAASTATLSVAQKTSAIRMGAMSVAAKGLKTALAAIGGPLGFAFIAGAALLYFTNRATGAEIATDKFNKSLEKLRTEFDKNADAANATTENLIQSKQSELDALLDQWNQFNELVKQGAPEGVVDTWRALKEALKFSDIRVPGIFEGDAVEQNIARLREEIRKLREESKFLNEGAALIEYSDKLESIFGKIGRTIPVTADEVQKAFDKLYPQKATIQKLEDTFAVIEAAQKQGLAGVTQEDVAAARALVDEEIKRLQDLAAARDDGADKARQYAEKVKAALDQALPDEAQIRALREQLVTLQTEYNKGGASAEKFGRAIEVINAQISDLELSDANRALERFNTALSRQLPNPLEGYVTDLQVLTDGLDQFPDKAQQIQLAIARLNATAASELTKISAGGDKELAAQEYQFRISQLEEFWELNKTVTEVKQEQLLELAKNYADKLSEIQKKEFEKIDSFLSAARELSPDSKGQAFETDANLARAAAAAIDNEKLRTDTLAQIEEAYQRRRAEIVRAGQGTVEQIEQSNFADRVAGLINRYDQEIELAGRFADALIGLKANREKAEADAALANAKNLADEAQKAQKLYEQTGTEANRELARQAKLRAQIAETAARKEFEQQKKAQLQQAKLSQMLAIINAFATGGNWYTGAALAVIAKLETQKAIDQIKAQQFNSGSSTLSNLSGGVGDSVTRVGGSTSTTSEPTVNERVVIVSGNFKSEDEALAEAGRALEKTMQQGWVTQTDNGQLDFRNLPREVVRLS